MVELNKLGRGQAELHTSQLVQLNHLQIQKLAALKVESA